MHLLISLTYLLTSEQNFEVWHSNEFFPSLPPRLLLSSFDGKLIESGEMRCTIGFERLETFLCLNGFAVEFCNGDDIQPQQWLLRVEHSAIF